MSLDSKIAIIIQNVYRKNENRKFFREPLVAFSVANDPLYHSLKTIIGEHHLLPTEILKEAQTVISFFIPFSEFVITANKQNFRVAEEWLLGYIKANQLINKISEALILYFQTIGVQASLIKASHSYDFKTLQATWSHKSAALIAGLGSLGQNRQLITAKGAAGRLGTVIISEKITINKEIPPDYCLELQGQQCSYCLKNCPTKALTVDGFDKFKCQKHLLEINESFTDLNTCDACGKCAVGPCAIF